MTAENAQNERNKRSDLIRIIFLPINIARKKEIDIDTVKKTLKKITELVGTKRRAIICRAEIPKVKRVKRKMIKIKK
ncbi:MAG: hypothetical protein ACOC4M_09700 [Promethearchaeia archaeon]